jgi:hypothetical protein
LAATFFLRRFVPVIVACAGLVATPAAAGHTPLTDRNLDSLTDDEIVQLAGLLTAEWQTSLSGKLGVGWDSNLLLSDLVREESGFGRVNVEGMLWRPAQEQRPVELVGFLSADYRRFFSPQSLPEETEAFLQGEARWRPTPPLRLSLLAQGYYLDSVLDLSTESERLSTPLRNAGGKAGVAVRWDLGPRWWVEATGTSGRSDFRLLPEDYTEDRWGVRAGWQSASGTLKLAAGARESDRRYHERNVTTIGGRPLPGTQLRYRAPEFEVSLEDSAEWHGRWRFSGTLTGARNDDNGAGYFNYRLGKMLANVEWTHGDWEVDSSCETSCYHWDEQVAGIGLAPPFRQRREVALSLQVNRQLGEHWFVFAEVERECVWSNDPSASYNLTVLSTGVGLKL